MAANQLQQLQANCRDFEIPLYDLDDPKRGIVHVIGPELGLTQPGLTIVCGDSHTATHGAFGALAFGIGTSEVAHVLSTQTLLQTKPKTYQVNFNGHLGTGVTAKDMILALIAKIGIGGGTGHVFEYSGPAVQALDMEGRMTLCNMSIEAGARAGMIAPDSTTYEYLAGREFAPQGQAWEDAVETWQALPSDPGAMYDMVLDIDVSQLEPMVTYGTNPGMGFAISESIPDPQFETDSLKRSALEKALDYMDLQPGTPILDKPINVVFIGSCTNSRISDLRMAANLLKGQRIAEGVRLLVVPGSESVRRQAEAEGLDRVFEQAGGEWRYAGCSMCIAMNGDQLTTRAVRSKHQQPQFRRTPGKRGTHFLGQPPDCGCECCHRARNRSTANVHQINPNRPKEQNYFDATIY